MGRVKINDLPKDFKLSEEAMKEMLGGRMSVKAKRRPMAGGDSDAGGWGARDIWNAVKWPYAQLWYLTKH